MITEAAAVSNARMFLKLPESISSFSYRVTNLLNPGEDYFLVVFGNKDTSEAVAAVDSKNGEIKSYAFFSGKNKHIGISKEKALNLVNADPSAKIEMAWMPSLLSHSQLYPFWKIFFNGKTKYVNLQGTVSDEIMSGMRG